MMTAGAAFALVVCTGLGVMAVTTFVSAAVLVRRARRVEARAREVLEEATREREAGVAVLEEAKRVHADCQRPRVNVVPVLPGGVPQWSGKRGVA